MAQTGRYAAVDLGAESGRVVLGTIREGRLDLAEVHRFLNEPQWLLGRFCWDTVRLFAEIKTGLARCAREHDPRLDGIGLDTWGVDFALLDADDEVLGLPRHYRDPRTNGVMERTFQIVSREEIYRTTGIQFMQINSLFQLMALRFARSPLLEAARHLLFMPDLLNFWLTGRRANEVTIASTSQCWDPVSGDWARGMLDRLGIPAALFCELVPPGTTLGTLHESVQRDTGLGAVPVIAPATHDTGSAVAAVPAEGAEDWAYVSCGTWSLVGIESPRPVITDRSLECNLTNEAGVGGTTRLLGNVMGLWILQQCRRAWERAGRRYGYDELAALAAQAPPHAALIDPDDPRFLNPPDMPAAIADFCRETGQTPPESVAAITRCIVESLALKYRWVLDRLEEVAGRPIGRVHLIGGGSQNRQLCQATADASGRPVLAGPVEATAAGNVVVQAMGAGRLESLAAARALVRASFPLQEYRPADTTAWDSAYARFLSLLRG